MVNIMHRLEDFTNCKKFELRSNDIESKLYYNNIKILIFIDCDVFFNKKLFKIKSYHRDGDICGILFIDNKKYNMLIKIRPADEYCKITLNDLDNKKDSHKFPNFCEFETIKDNK